MIRGHPFASDEVLAFALAALVVSEILTSKEYLTGSNWVYVPVALVMTVPLARILQKLDLRDRVHAVIVAYESGLVEIGVAQRDT